VSRQIEVMEGDPAAQRTWQRTHARVLLDGVLLRLMDAWTGGFFLAGAALLAGANGFELGLLARARQLVIAAVRRQRPQPDRQPAEQDAE